MSKHNLPSFQNIEIDHIPSNIEKILDENRQKLSKLLQQPEFTWENLMAPLEELGEHLHQFWSKVNHMNAVVNSDELRKAYNECLPKLSQYYTEMSHNTQLYNAIQAIANSPQYQGLSLAQQKVLDNNIRDFKLAGVALDDDQKKEFAKLVAKLSQLTTKFEENVLDATHAFEKHITDESHLSGIPQQAIAQAKQRAEEKKFDGWLLTLEMPCYLAVIMHADSRELREDFYRAYVTRASEHSKKWDNSEVMRTILDTRLALAKLLAFENYAEESLATKMADSPQQVISFLTQLADKSKHQAQNEFQSLTEFARNELNLEQLNAWDISYASEKLRQQRYNISQEELRPYFAEKNVVEGLFNIVKRLYQIDIIRIENQDIWHPDVKCYAIKNQHNEIISYFYTDLYARPNKRGGAWMDDCQSRRKLNNGEIKLPIAFITCNFQQPTKEQPALFSHDEVVTLFHEFGHALQHMLTTIDCSDVSGINGIPWDAVELASQFMENWAWQQDSLCLFAKHHQTHEILPKAMFERLYKARNFQSAMQMLRQLELALFDFLLHMEYQPDQSNQIQAILNRVRDQVSVVPTPSFNRFQHGFSHIFAGGYAAGYYSYKWAEVMASDAFSLFLENGIFDQKTATAFCEYILQPGGSEDPLVLFKKYRGHEPKVEALLTQSGITEK